MIYITQNSFVERNILTYNFELILKKSIGSVSLEMNKADVIRILGEPDHIHNNMHYYKSSYQIEYRNDQVKFIEATNDSGIAIRYLNKNLFDLKDSEILNLFSDIGNLNTDDREHGFVFNYDDIQLKFYREHMPEDVEEEINSLNKDSIDYEIEKDSLLVELEYFRYFDSISIYTKDYYSGIENNKYLDDLSKKLKNRNHNINIPKLKLKFSNDS